MRRKTKKKKKNYEEETSPSAIYKSGTNTSEDRGRERDRKEQSSFKLTTMA